MYVIHSFSTQNWLRGRPFDFLSGGGGFWKWISLHCKSWKYIILRKTATIALYIDIRCNLDNYLVWWLMELNNVPFQLMRDAQGVSLFPLPYPNAHPNPYSHFPPPYSQTKIRQKNFFSISLFLLPLFPRFLPLESRFQSPHFDVPLPLSTPRW